MDALEDISLEELWATVTGGVLVALIGGTILFPREVYAEFVWQYFWGPVYADANGASCAVWDGGAQTLLGSTSACRGASGIVAYPGYTLVSEVGYMVVLLLSLVGVILLLRRLDVGEERSMFYALLPFMFFGGALRVVEDANDVVPAGGEGAITYPLNALIISPVIYVTVFVIALSALVGAVWLARTGRTERYERPLFGAGVAVLTVTLGYLTYLGLVTERVDFFPQVTLLTLAIATVATGATWWVLREYAPEVLSGTRLMGAVVIWGHAVDGAANVLILDWSRALGLGVDYTPKHPVNRAIVEFTESVLPADVTSVVGAAWPFLLVKLAAAALAVWLFNEEVFDESPRYSVLLLVAILAVGLGPGTRDMLRATFGV